MVLATALMAAVVGASVYVLQQRSDLDRTGPALVALALASGVGALTYLIVSLALGLSEPRELVARIRHRGSAEALES